MTTDTKQARTPGPRRPASNPITGGETPYQAAYDEGYRDGVADKAALVAFVQHVADLHPDEPLGDDARKALAAAGETT